jgi:hypothetical protein
VTPGTTPSFDGELLLQIGGLITDGPAYSLDGDVAELLIFSPALASSDDYEAVRDYLNAKWDL